MYAVPIHAGGETVGAVNFGYGTPPTDETELQTLSKKYKIPINKLRKQAEVYKPRPQFIIDYAKERIHVAATQLGRIIDRKQAEEKLRKTLKEKDFLMKELNHRVKNNLAMVSSLISLKESEIENDLSDLKHRIEVIKLVHEKLHQQNDREQIEVKEYFQEILESVFYSASRLTVDIINNIEDVSIPTKTAIPLGLIVNEIATNAVKHGFAKEEQNRFSIVLKKNVENKQYILILSNSGNLFPKEVDIKNPKTLGLQLLCTLVSQLNGAIELQKQPTPLFTIHIPIEEEQTR